MICDGGRICDGICGIGDDEICDDGMICDVM